MAFDPTASIQEPPQDGRRGPLRRRFWFRAAVACVALYFVALLYDAEVSRALTNWPAHEVTFFEWLTRWGEADWILIPALVVAIGAFLMRGLHLAYTTRWTVTALGGLSWYIFIGVGAPGLVATILKRLLGRARPMHLDDMGALSFHPFQPDWSLAGFPSGHATIAFALAVILSTVFAPRWRLLFFGVAGLIGLSRVVVGMHFLTDVAAGAALGIIGAGLVSVWFANRGFPVRNTPSGVRNRVGSALRRGWRRVRVSGSAS